MPPLLPLLAAQLRPPKLPTLQDMGTSEGQLRIARMKKANHQPPKAPPPAPKRAASIDCTVMGKGTAYKLEMHEPHKPAGYYLHYPEGFDRKSVEPAARGWFKKRADAEAEALRLAAATGDAFMVVRLVSKCVPWQCLTPAQNTGLRQEEAGGDRVASKTLLSVTEKN